MSRRNVKYLENTLFQSYSQRRQCDDKNDFIFTFSLSRSDVSYNILYLTELIKSISPI